MKNILIASFDMEVGGVERSLINLLENFDYDKYNVDLMLYRHTGDFMKFLKGNFNLLDEIPEYASFRKPIVELVKGGKFSLAAARLKARKDSKSHINTENAEGSGYMQMQRMWQYSLKKLPKLEKEYDVAISYLWPHYFIAEKVMAKKKIAWIHTDYSTIELDNDEDLRIWRKFDYLVAVSEGCKNAFLKKYPSLEDKVVVMENIISPQFIRTMAEEKVEDNISKDKSFKLVSVGRLSTAKGFDRAVLVLNDLHKRGYKDIKWYIVGYGGDEELIRSLIKKYGLEDSFILLGKKLNPYPYMKACDLYVQPSRYEGRAVTVTEAQVLGKAAIITDYETAKYQLKDGYDGYICGNNEKSIADAIEYFYKNKHKKEEMEYNCRNNLYDNKEQLEILYNLIEV